jgi:hypothetical protein
MTFECLIIGDQIVSSKRANSSEHTIPRIITLGGGKIMTQILHEILLTFV